jgi:hypothetical protein
MKIFCMCGDSKTRHRAQFGESGTGACFDCGCSLMTPGRYVLSIAELRFLEKIAESEEIGWMELRKQIYDANDPASGAFDAILHNLHAARFTRDSFTTDTPTVSATAAGREYLREVARA